MTQLSRISSLDPGYASGDLSLYPIAKDDKVQLYEARNNSETKLKQSLSYNSRYIIAEDASSFPPSGLLRVGRKGPGSPELVYYGKRSDTIFSNLIRGFAGSRQNSWPSTDTFVANAVMAEHHNSVKDALLKIEQNVGLKNFPNPESLHGLLKALETRFLSPKPLFRTFPRSGPAPLTVRFQNFSEGGALRYLWEFGDGTKSIQRSPFHTYQQEGIYTVKLNIITSTGGQGVAIKNNYITVDNKAKAPFFYSEPTVEGPNYSIETANALGVEPQEFLFVDQTDAATQQRYWVFDDGTNEIVADPDLHTIKHTYATPGTYKPSLLLVFGDQNDKRVFMSETIEVL